MDASRRQITAHAVGPTAAGMIVAVLRILQTLVVTALVSVGVLLLASANFSDTSDPAAVGVALALLLFSVLILPAGGPN